MIITKGMFIDIRNSEFSANEIHNYLCRYSNKFYTKQIIFDHTKNVIEWTDKGLAVNSKNLMGSSVDVTEVLDGDIRYELFKSMLPTKFICRASEVNLFWLAQRGVTLLNGKPLSSISGKANKIAVKNKIAYLCQSNKICEKFPTYKLVSLDFVKRRYYIVDRKLKQGNKS